MLSIIKGPYLQWPTENTMTIMWETSEPASSRAEVLLAERIHSGYHGNYKPPEHIISTFYNNEPVVIHQVTVTGLEPATTYFYKIHSENEQGSVTSTAYPFKTAVRSGASFSFTVTSETGGYSAFDPSGGELNKRIFSQMQRYRPDLALFIGDIVDDGRNYDDWDKYFFTPGKDFLNVTPSYSCLGNHEDNGSWYYDLFAFAPPKNYYSFDYGDVHFTCLDSTAWIDSAHYPHSNGSIGPGDAQYNFLLHDLQSTSAKWKVVFFHYPPYVSGGYQVEDLRVLCPVFEAYGVDVVINSHTIVYERSQPLHGGQVDYDKGIVYIVAGGAGAMEDWLLPKREWHTAQSVAVPHFIQVIVTVDKMEFRMIDDEGRLFDIYYIKKDADGKKVHW
ncbi:metallophosphoesterase family protein [Paenibacillaceae bacterium]|nr:metallophosphoesterase family protein [Paenibacillaceae bacterium]